MHLEPTATVAHDIECAARCVATVLITGGDPTRRLAAARLVHERSARCAGPFVVCDGAETCWEAAAGGTAFLQEVGDLDAVRQNELLQLLDRPRDRPNALRIIGGSGCDLAQRIAANTFSDTLFYRLNVIHIMIPTV